MNARRVSLAQVPVRGLHAASHALDRPRRARLRLQGFLGRHLSIRWKLTLWYGLMCAVTLGVLGFGMKAVLQAQTSRSIDTTLENTAARLLPVLTVHGAEYNVLVPSQAYATFRHQLWEQLRDNSFLIYSPGVFEQVQIFNAGSSNVENNLVTPRCEKCNQGLWLGTEGEYVILPRVMSTGSPEFLTTDSDGQQFRVLLVRLAVNEGLQEDHIGGVLEIVQSEKTYSDIENTLSVILLFGIPVALLIALALGWWIARAALRPIERISRTVRAVGESRDLSRRVKFVGPIDEVGRLALTFDGMLERLERAFEMQKRFVADASHELRTPLTAIRGNADLITIAPPEERDACISAIRRESERMSRLVSDLLLLAAADSDEVSLQQMRVDLDAVLADVVRSAHILAGDKVEIELTGVAPVTVRGDADRLKQVFLNLIDNAIKFTPRGGQVRIGLVRAGAEAIVSVQDTGIGIPPEDQTAIFDRFYRVEHARSTRGAGLGLSICSWIVSAHGGRIEVTSTPGEGSTFTVHLPVIE